jgi:hypothetical protein
MPRDMKEKLMDFVILGCIAGLVLGIISFVLIFVNTGVATVLAIFSATLLIVSCIFIGTNLIIKSIEENSDPEKKTKEMDN